MKSVLGCALLTASAQTPPIANQTPFQMKVTSNLVVVRVVVRDAQGHPVQDLTKEDFKLFDRSKLQSISQFAADTPPNTLASTPAIGQPANTNASWSALPQRFFALYFDDLDMKAGDLMQVRNAAERYLAANVRPNDRVAIYTSGSSLTDFTGDPKLIHDALDKLQFSPLAQEPKNCPDLSDYQAQQIVEFDDENIDAWVVAKDQAINDSRCAQIPLDQPAEPQRYINGLARRVIEVAGTRSRANLQELQKVVDYISQMPGQRMVVLVSPGYLSRGDQPDLDRVINHALHAEVVIHSLDPRGLVSVQPEQDVSRVYTPSGAAMLALHRLVEDREANARDVLQEVARGTGGNFFHDSNDLEGGFKSLAAVPAYYLGFDPTEIKPNGKFHALKVELTLEHKGFTIEARRGYFAAGGVSENVAVASTDTDSQVKEQLREAIFTKSDLPKLPLRLDVKVFATATDDRELQVTGRLNTRLLSNSDSRNTITFVSAVFDQKGSLVKLQRGEGQVENAGASMESSFQLKPGVYRVREVVTEAEGHQLAAVSRVLDVRSECCASREEKKPQTIPASSPPVPVSSPQAPANVEISYLDFPLRKLRAAVPDLGEMKADESQEQLPHILSRVGEVTQASLATIPNLISQEDVYTLVTGRDSAPVNSVLGLKESPELLNLEGRLRDTRSVEFNYLLLFDHPEGGGTAIREQRTDLKNRPVSQVGPHGFGFAYQWLLLTAANQSELRFRYLGKQMVDNHQTYVLGFVQVPDQVKLPAKYQWADQQASFFFQGIAWIDQSSFQVVRLRTDLLSPVPSLNLEFLTTELHFSPVHLHGLSSALWLPSEVLIRTVRSDTIFQELHDYAHYRFFHAESKLIP